MGSDFTPTKPARPTSCDLLPIFPGGQLFFVAVRVGVVLKVDSNRVPGARDAPLRFPGVGDGSCFHNYLTID